jgi:hypothetical protein
MVWSTREPGTAICTAFRRLLMIALCTVPCGRQRAMDRALCAKAKEPILCGFLKLANR